MAGSLSGWNWGVLPGPGASDWELETRPRNSGTGGGGGGGGVFRTVPTGAARAIFGCANRRCFGREWGVEWVLGFVD